MGIEYKSVGVLGVEPIGGADSGIVAAFVSVTGIKDKVNDTIIPGAYAKSLKARVPKGVWHHNWQQPVSRTESIEELLPGTRTFLSSFRTADPGRRRPGRCVLSPSSTLVRSEAGMPTPM